jgi:hypothetical protein
MIRAKTVSAKNVLPPQKKITSEKFPKAKNCPGEECSERRVVRQRKRIIREAEAEANDSMV